MRLVVHLIVIHRVLDALFFLSRVNMLMHAELDIVIVFIIIIDAKIKVTLSQ